MNYKKGEVFVDERPYSTKNRQQKTENENGGIVNRQSKIGNGKTAVYKFTSLFQRKHAHKRCAVFWCGFKRNTTL